MTLIELIIVIAILVILAGILIPVFNSFISKSKDAVDLASAHLLYTAALLNISDSDNTDISGIYTSDANGQTPVLFEEYIGPSWPKPQITGAKYFEILIDQSGSNPIIEVHRVYSEYYETYERGSKVFN